MEGNFVYNFLIEKDFLNTRSGQSAFLLTNQNAHLITHETNKISLYKSHNLSEQASVVKMKAISALNSSKSKGEMPKDRWKQKKWFTAL